MTRTLRWTAGLVAVSVMGLQLTSPPRTNPAFDQSQSIERITNVPIDLAGTFTRACLDCHSNQTRWRWYTHIAPISWLTASHVSRGRAELNFSLWGTYGTRMRETRLRAMCDLARERVMPPPSYALLHPGAALSPNQIGSICEWTKTELRRASRGGV